MRANARGKVLFVFNVFAAFALRLELDFPSQMISLLCPIVLMCCGGPAHCHCGLRQILVPSGENQRCMPSVNAVFPWLLSERSHVPWL
jgi:hypothetical protein